MPAIDCRLIRKDSPEQSEAHTACVRVFLRISGGPFSIDFSIEKGTLIFG
jgi:hypothetical protein